MFYDRKIKYLDYYENGERTKGGGFVKLEVRDGSLRIDVTVTGLHPTDSFERDILLCGKKEEKALGKIVISQGRGHYLQECRDLDDIGGIGLNYGELQGIRIPIGTGREITGSWQKAQETGRENPLQNHNEIRIAQQDAEDRQEGEERNAGGSTQDKTDDGWESRRSLRNSSDDVWGNIGSGQKSADDDICGSTGSGQKTPENEKKRNIMQAENPIDREEGGKPRNIPEGKTVGRGVANKDGKTTAKQSVKLMEDKWSQLWAIYPHVRPFRDGREYLSIGPADFVLFSADAYKMANNSFLLHGYYNYNHLILTRIEKKGEILYYIGAPGNYYEREKQVAIMFGFESFECAEEPAQTGDFGYYMMRTQL